MKDWAEHLVKPTDQGGLRGTIVEWHDHHDGATSDGPPAADSRRSHLAADDVQLIKDYTFTARKGLTPPTWSVPVEVSTARLRPKYQSRPERARRAGFGWAQEALAPPAVANALHTAIALARRTGRPPLQAHQSTGFPS